MKKVIVSTQVSLILVALMISVVSFGKDAKIAGTWNYSAPYAPYEYSEGQIIIEETDGSLTGKVKIDSYEMELDEVTYKDSVLSFTLYVEGEYVSVKVTIKGKKFEGNASTSEGPLKVTGERAK